jgi:hypothetical protein
MGASPAGLGRAHDWPCVGDPAHGVMFACGHRGDLSLLTTVAGSQVMDVDDDGPVVVHMTVCKSHVKVARRWLAARTREPIDTYGTEQLLREWGQVREILEDTPVYSMVSTA